MSEIIGFEARDFQNDPTCQGRNVSSRMYVTDPIGGNVEIFEIGDNGGNWTQISCEMKLEKNKDYCFKFATVTDNSYVYKDYKSQFMVMPLHPGDNGQDDWDRRFVYDLVPGRFNPVSQKRFGNSVFRIFDVPFNSGDTDTIRFIFLAFQRPVRIFPVRELEAYCNLPEVPIERGTSVGQFGDYGGPFYGTGNGFFRIIGQGIAAIFRKLIEFLNGNDSSNRLTDNTKSLPNNAAKNIISNKTIFGSELSQQIYSMGNGGSLTLMNCAIRDDANIPDPGVSLDGATFNFTNSNIDGASFCMLSDKIGFNNKVTITNCQIGDVNYHTAMSAQELFDGCTINITNTRMSSQAAAFFMSKIGCGCHVNMSNCRIFDGAAYPYGNPFTGTSLNLSAVSMSGDFREGLRSRVGMGCTVRGL